MTFYRQSATGAFFEVKYDAVVKHDDRWKHVNNRSNSNINRLILEPLFACTCTLTCALMPLVEPCESGRCVCAKDAGVDTGQLERKEKKKTKGKTIAIALL